MIDREFLRGFTKLYALWRASKKEAYGMAILKEMREVGFDLSPGTLYPTLEKLRREGDITCGGGSSGGGFARRIDSRRKVGGS